MGEIDFCHIVTGHGLQTLADVWPICDLRFLPAAILLAAVRQNIQCCTRGHRLTINDYVFRMSTRKAVKTKIGCIHLCVKIMFQCSVLLQNSELVVVVDYEIWFTSPLNIMDLIMQFCISVWVHYDS